MSSELRFMLSPKFIENVLDNSFGLPTENYTNTTIYVGLGIEFDENTFSFTKEPVSKGFTINKDPIEFSTPTDGIIRNIKAIEWDKAKVNWTENGETIKWVGLYYAYQTDDLNKEIQYELIAVLPLVPAEEVKINERLVLNPNAIQIRLANR